MKKYEINQIEEALDRLEKEVVRNGLARKYLLDIRSARNACADLHKKALKDVK